MAQMFHLPARVVLLNASHKLRYNNCTSKVLVVCLHKIYLYIYIMHVWSDADHVDKICRPYIPS